MSFDWSATGNLMLSIRNATSTVELNAITTWMAFKRTGGRAGDIHSIAVDPNGDVVIAQVSVTSGGVYFMEYNYGTTASLQQSSPVIADDEWHICGLCGRNNGGTTEIKMRILTAAGNYYDTAWVAPGQDTEEVTSIHVGPPWQSYHAAFRNGPLKAWSSSLSDADWQAERVSASAIITANRIVECDFQGTDATDARNSEYEVGTWAQTFDSLNANGGSTGVLPTYSTDNPAFAGNLPTLSGDITLPATAPALADAVRVIQSVGDTSLGTGVPVTLTLPQQPQYGNMVTVALGGWLSNAIGATVTDNQNPPLSWFQRMVAARTPGGEDVWVLVWSARVTSSTAPFTLTVTPTNNSAPAYYSACALEMEGANDASPLDQAATASTTGSGTSGTINVGSTTATNELLLLVSSTNNNSTVTNGPSTYTQAFAKPGNGALYVGHRYVTTTGDYDPTLTFSPTAPWVAGVLAIKNITAAAPTIVTTTLVQQEPGVAFVVQLEASGTGPITWSLNAGSSLPSGVTLSSTGRLSGTAPAGTHNWTAKAENGSGSDTQALTLQVGPVATTKRLICIGDSLTAGAESDPGGYRSYRGALQLLLQNAGYVVDFVGTQSSTPATGGNDPEHDGYGGARISDSTNNLYSRIPSIRDSVGNVDMVVLYVGWNDVYQATAGADTKYESLVTLIRSGVWASAKVLLVTLSPEPNKTPAQTGSDYPIYAQLNTKIRALASGSADVAVADLAALTGTGTDERSTMVERLLYDETNPPDSTTLHSGDQVPAPYGGHMVCSFKGIQDFNANWSTNPPAVSWPPPGGNPLKRPTPDVYGHPYFMNSVQSMIGIVWIFAAEGHGSTNTGVEVRNMSAQVWRGSTGQWEFLYQGARGGSPATDTYVYWVSNSNTQGTPNSLALARAQPDGITTLYRPHWDTGIEAWPEDTSPSRGIQNFIGGRNRAAMADAVCWATVCQMRLVLVDPNGPNDIAQSNILVRYGYDLSAAGSYQHYDYWGWPLNVMDGGNHRWRLLKSTDWSWVGCVAIGTGTDGGWADPGTPPPLGFWSPPTPYNDISAGRGKTATQVRTNPPRLPDYYTPTSQSSGSGWIASDYWDNPDIGTKDIHWSQQGADKAARVIFDALVVEGWLSGATGGGPIAPSLLPGIATVARWWPRFTTEATDPDTADWELAQVAQSTTPSWPSPYGIPAAVVGSAYSATLVAYGTATITYSHISGKPSWMSVASNGALTGTPNETADTSYSIVFRATNTQGTADVTLPLTVSINPVITTTTLPGAAQNQQYLQILQVTGTGPFTWTTQSGTWPTGISLSSAGIVSGTPTGTGTSSNIVVRATSPTGAYDEQTLSLTVSASGTAPSITVSSMAGATKNVAYSQTITATGSGTLTWQIVSGALPTGTTLNTANGLVSGTPTVSGSFLFDVRVSSVYGTATKSLFIYVAEPAVGGSSATVESPWGRFLK